MRLGHGPDDLVYTVLRGIKRQMMACRPIQADQIQLSLCCQQSGKEEVEKFYDDISGEQLPTKLVQEARAEEVGWIHKIGLYDKVPRGPSSEEREANTSCSLAVGWMSTRATSRATRFA